MTTYEKLIKIENENDNFSIEVKNIKENYIGVIHSYGENNENIALYYGNDDGSDDKTISIEELNRNFEIISYIDEYGKSIKCN